MTVGGAVGVVVVQCVCVGGVVVYRCIWQDDDDDDVMSVRHVMMMLCVDDVMSVSACVVFGEF